MHPNLKLWEHLDNYKKALEPFDKSKYKELEKLCKGNAQFKEEMDRFYKEQFWDKSFGTKSKAMRYKIKIAQMRYMTLPSIVA